MRTRHRPRRPFFQVRGDKPDWLSGWKLDLDLVDLMLDLDPGMLDHSWLDTPPR